MEELINFELEDVLMNKKLTEKEIRELIKKYNLLSNDNIEVKQYYWLLMTIHQRLSESFIEEFQDKFILYWRRICLHQKLSESFIEKFQDMIYWDIVTRTQELSEDFIRKHSDKVDIYYATEKYLLSEKFMNDFKDEINWKFVAENYNLSLEFIKENLNLLELENLMLNPYITSNLLKNIKTKVRTV